MEKRKKNMKVSIHKVDQVSIKGKGEKIYLFGRDINKKQVIFESYGHRPYFYVNNKNEIPFMKEITSHKNGFISIFDETLTKITTKHSNYVPVVRKNFPSNECYEDDILYYLRWLIDNQIKNGILISNNSDKIYYKNIKPIDFFVEPRRVHLDMEVLTGEGGKIPDWNHANKRITGISIVDSYSKLVVSFTNRKKYGNKLKKILRVKEDVLVYEEETPLIKTEKRKIKTEIGTEYKWIIKYYKTQLMVYFKDKTLKKVKDKILIETLMLNHFLTFFRKLKVDFFCGWNIIGFDLPYLVFRMKRLGIDYTQLSPINVVLINTKYTFKQIVEIKGVVVFDTMLGYKKLQTHKVSLKLEDVASKVLGYGKVKYTGSLDNLYYNNEEKFLYYNAIDVIGEYEVFKTMNLIDFFGGLKQYIGIPYEDVRDNKSIVDFFLLSKAKQRNIVLPTSRYNKEQARKYKKVEKFKGAFVLVPTKKGRNEDILSIDLKSLYPCIMISWNIGHDSYIGSIPYEIDKFLSIFNLFKPKENNMVKTTNIKGYVHIFDKSKQSFIAECLKELIDYRDELKEKLLYMKKYKERDGYSDDEIKRMNNQQMVVKFITNSIYGVLGYRSFRLYDERFAESVTLNGQMIIKESLKLIENHGYEVIYADSIIGERCVAIKINDCIEILPIEQLWDRFYKEKYNNSYFVVNKHTLPKGKEHILLNNVFTLSKYGTWQRIKEIIRHKTDKDIYRVNQTHGETICTEDHSIFTKYGETKPKDIGNNEIIYETLLQDYKPKFNNLEKIDLYELLKDFTLTKEIRGTIREEKWNIKDDNYLWFGYFPLKKQKTINRYVNIEDLCKLLGIYIADGHSSTSCNRFSSGIASSNLKFIKEVKEIAEKINNSYDLQIIQSNKKGKRILRGKEYICNETYRLQMNNKTFGALFHFLCGSGSENKHLPQFIYNINRKYQKILYNWYLKGDGYKERKLWSFTTKSVWLVSGLCFLLKSWGINIGIHYYKNRDVYEVRERIITNCHSHLAKNYITKLENTDRYVYDLSVENTNIFLDCCGMVWLHNTDSNYIQLKIPESEEEIERLISIFEENCDEDEKPKFNRKEKIYIGLSYHLTDILNNFYKSYVKKFNLRENYLSIKPEDVNSVYFTVKLKHGTRTAKKRYAKRKIIEFILDKPIKMNEVDIKGFIRSDLSNVGNEVLKNVLEMACLEEDDEFVRNKIELYLRKEIDKIKKMEYDFTEICRNVGMQDHFNEYSKIVKRKDEKTGKIKTFKKSIPMHVRAGRWTNDHARLWGGNSNLGKGSKIKYLFVKREKMFEGYARSEVVALDDQNYLPKKFIEILDFETIIEKTILDPLSEILKELDINIRFIKGGKKQKEMF